MIEKTSNLCLMMSRPSPISRWPFGLKSNSMVDTWHNSKITILFCETFPSIYKTFDQVRKYFKSVTPCIDQNCKQQIQGEKNNTVLLILSLAEYARC